MRLLEKGIQKILFITMTSWNQAFFLLSLICIQINLKYRRWLFLLFQRIRRKFTRNSIRRFLSLLTRFQIEAKKTHRNPISYFISDVSTLNIANLILLIRQCIQCPFGCNKLISAKLHQTRTSRHRSTLVSPKEHDPIDRSLRCSSANTQRFSPPHCPSPSYYANGF